MTGKPDNPSKADKKIEVTVATTGPASQPDSVSPNVPLKTVVKKAFDDLGITAESNTFSFRNEAGRTVNLDDKVHEACDEKTPCKIYATPIKAQDA
jgi:hypothetical protein